jgi:formylglycine-generating enzyme required for sulfatase activity
MMKYIFKIALIIITVFVFFACHGKKDDKKEKTGAEAPQITIGSAEMVKIPAGPFKMGSDSDIDELEAPERLVTTGEYWIDKFEYPSVLGEMPLTNVTWYKARDLCRKQGKDLPTERQWEKACRGPEGYIYPYGNTYDKRKSRTDLSWRDGPAVSGAYPESVSGYGVYDMSGNVWEWTLGEDIEGRAVRGGFWQSTDFESRCSNRMFFHPTYPAPNIGFRCVKVEKEEPKTLGEYWDRLKKRYVLAMIK